MIGGGLASEESSERVETPSCNTAQNPGRPLHLSGFSV